MTAASIPGARFTGTLRLTWVQDHLAHVLDHCQTDEPSGTWTGLACPSYGLHLGADVDNPALQRLAIGGEIADLIWEPPGELTAGHGQLFQAAIQADHAANSQLAEQPAQYSCASSQIYQFWASSLPPGNPQRSAWTSMSVASLRSAAGSSRECAYRLGLVRRRRDAPGSQGRLGPVGGLELVEDAGDVVLHCSKVSTLSASAFTKSMRCSRTSAGRPAVIIPHAAAVYSAASLGIASPSMVASPRAITETAAVSLVVPLAMTVTPPGWGGVTAGHSGRELGHHDAGVSTP